MYRSLEVSYPTTRGDPDPIPCYFLDPDPISCYFLKDPEPITNWNGKMCENMGKVHDFLKIFGLHIR